MTKEASRPSKRVALVAALGHPWTYSICSLAAAGECRERDEVTCNLPTLSGTLQRDRCSRQDQSLRGEYRRCKILNSVKMKLQA